LSSVIFFSSFENPAVYETNLKNMVHPEMSQTTVQICVA